MTPCYLVVIVGIGSVYGISEQDDQFYLWEYAGDSLWRMRVKQVVGTGFTCDKRLLLETSSKVFLH